MGEDNVREFLYENFRGFIPVFQSRYGCFLQASSQSTSQISNEPFRLPILPTGYGSCMTKICTLDPYSVLEVARDKLPTLISDYSPSHSVQPRAQLKQKSNTNLACRSSSNCFNQRKLRIAVNQNHCMKITEPRAHYVEMNLLEWESTFRINESIWFVWL